MSTKMKKIKKTEKKRAYRERLIAWRRNDRERAGDGAARMLPAIRMTDMVAGTTCRLNGLLAALIGLRECPTDPMFDGVVQLVEDLIEHAHSTEEAAYAEYWRSMGAHERSGDGF